MEAWLERLYARLGRRYVPFLVGAMVVGGLSMCATTVAAGAGYLDAGLGPSLRVFAVMGPQLLASVGVGLFVARADLRTLAAWTRAGEPASGAAEETGDGVLCTEATRLALQRDGAVLRPRGERVLRGKAEPTPLYAVA